MRKLPLRSVRPTWHGCSSAAPTASSLRRLSRGKIGPDLFALPVRWAWMKGRASTYRAGRSPDWIKVKNPASPAMTRAKEVDWSIGSRR